MLHPILMRELGQDSGDARDVYTMLGLPCIILCLHSKPCGRFRAINRSGNLHGHFGSNGTLFIEDTSDSARRHSDMPSKLTGADAKSFQFFLQNASGMRGGGYT